MKVTGLHWGLFLGLLVIGTALGFVLGDQYLQKREEKKALASAAEGE